MPFYLVTQTSLIEAEDENAAAQKSLDEIRSGEQVKITVKSDDASLSHIVIATKSKDVPSLDAAGLESAEGDQAVLSQPLSVVQAERKSALKRIVKTALNLVKRRL